MTIEETGLIRRGIAAPTVAVAVLTLLSSLLGYLREGGLAAVFGASAETDAYLVAFFVPHSLFLVLISGALAQAFVPTFVEYLTKGQREEAWEVASSVLNLLTPFLLALTAVAVLGAPLIVFALAPGLDGEAASTAQRLTRIMMPLVLFLSLSGVVSALLNSLGEFVVPAFSPLVGTSVILVSLFTLGRWVGIEGVAVGALAGAAAQLLVQLPALARRGFRYRWCFNFRHPGVRRIIALCLPLLAYVALSHSALYVERVVASGLATGSISVLNYAMRVFMMPLAIPMALSTVLFPTFASLAATDDRARLGQRVTQATRTIILVLAPVSMFFIVAGLPLVRLLFERGRFGDSDASITAMVLAGYSLGLVPTAVTQVFLRALYSLRDATTPILAETVSLLLYVPTSLSLAHAFDAPGLATARALAFYLMGLVVFMRLRRHIDLWHGWRGWWHTAKPLLAATASGLAVAFVMLPVVGATVGYGNLVLKGTSLLVLATVGFAIYGGACLALGTEGSAEAVAAARRLIGGSRRRLEMVREAALR